jgi:hypothetical protein
MCRRAALGLDPTPQAAGTARTFVAGTCTRWGADSVVDEVTLAVSELVTNAVLHAHTHIEVELCISRGTIEICVSDNDPRPPIVRPVRLDLLADLDAVPPTASTEADERHQSLHVGPSGSVAAGRGLLIVDALADEWGVSERADGKEVWLTMPVEWSTAHEPCDCEGRVGADRPGDGCRHIGGSWDGPN